MNAKLTKNLILTLLVGLAVLAALGGSLLTRPELYAVLSGYAVFAFNFALLARIYLTLVDVSKTGRSSSNMKVWLMLGSALKFFGLVAALYLMIVVWQLPGLYIAVGSLISVTLLTAVLVSSYLKNLAGGSAS